MQRTSGEKQGRIIVFGNEKGGSGKSTLAIHTAVGLLRLGFDVAVIDLDPKQGTLTRYLANRTHQKTKMVDLPMPVILDLPPIETIRGGDRVRMVGKAVVKTLGQGLRNHDFVIVDTAGYDTVVGRAAHGVADVIVTPMNASFIDLDLLAHLDAETGDMTGEGNYARKINVIRRVKADKGGVAPDWIVVRNRLPQDGESIVTPHLERLAGIMGFTLAQGFAERPLFKDLFLEGLTFMDVHERAELTLDMVRARQEVRQLVERIGLRRAGRSRRVATSYEGTSSSSSDVSRNVAAS